MAELKEAIKKLRKQLEEAGQKPAANDPIDTLDTISPISETWRKKWVLEEINP